VSPSLASFRLRSSQPGRTARFWGENLRSETGGSNAVIGVACSVAKPTKHSYSQNGGLADPHGNRLSMAARSVIGEANGCEAFDDRQAEGGDTCFLL
jgi:hypothetical protein